MYFEYNDKKGDVVKSQQKSKKYTIKKMSDYIANMIILSCYSKIVAVNG